MTDHTPPAPPKVPPRDRLTSVNTAEIETAEIAVVPSRLDTPAYGTAQTVVHYDVEHRRTRPHLRPPASLRLLVGLLAVSALLFNVALMISDRAPDATRRIFGDFASRLSDRIDASERASALGDGRLPESDAIVHIGVWAIATLLVALTIWTWWGLVVTAITVFSSSLLVEFAQGRYSSSRSVEVSDVFANAVGVSMGIVAATVCFALWSGVSGAARGIRRSRR